MAKHLFFSALLLGSSLANAAQSNAANAADEGFTAPLQSLSFTPGLDNFVAASDSAMDVYDPLEGWNRGVYQFNYHLDQWVMLPTVRGYTYVTPKFVRTGVSNFFSNLGDLPSLANSALQLKGERTMRTTARLLFNTIIGVGGIFDPATAMGLPREKEDFGQTLGYYGVPGGAYLVLPVFGPSNLRDTSGLVVDTLAEQSANYLNVAEESRRNLAIPVLNAIDTRYTTPYRYGQLNTPFEYSRVRYLYTEARKLQIAE
ncbi:MAG: VacJ family lipoprotein [Pseudomonadaceae bacterium]|nr:VacJ family lipoprotein [Pseudomonadaceae bacterium]